MEESSIDYEIVLACTGVPAHIGRQAAVDIAEEFTHQSWHRNVRCEWDGRFLILIAVNDYDENGLALMDEFSDAISACIEPGFDGGIEVRSIRTMPSAGS